MPERLGDYDSYNTSHLKGKRMNIKTTKLSIVTIISLLVVTIMTNLCNAQDEQQWSRKGKNELFGTFQKMGGETVCYSFPDILPVKLDFDSTTVYGAGYGYNLNDHWNINTDLLFGYADTEVKIVDVAVENVEMDYILWDINVDYNFLKGRLTPLVTGGIGLMDFSINTTATGVGRENESNFSYNLGAGVRWDVMDNLLLKVLYRTTKTEFDDNDLKYEGVSVSVAYMF
jgi:opacity protein-like surface antigen